MDRPALLNLSEAAAHFRCSPKKLRRLLVAAPDVRPVKAGRDLLFSPLDLASLESALRCPSPSALPDHERETDSGSPGEPSAGAASKSLRARQTRSLLGDLRSKLNGPSNGKSPKVVSLPPARS